MGTLRRLILAFILFAGVSPAIAQAPPPVPALPDTERRTSYVISASTCACSVGFQLYGDSTDYTNWLEVFINGALIPQSGNWTITSPTGSLATIPRPITDAVLTFTTAKTGTVQIVGARRPRRTSQFSESRGVAARDLNQVLSDLTAQNREVWDKINDVTGRSVRAPPGETLALLPALASRMNTGACFDSGGNLTTCASIPSSTTLIAGSGISITGTNPLVIASSLTASALPYTAPWTGAVSYTQDKYNRNIVYMTDFMGSTTCDGTNFIGGTGGVSSTTLTVTAVTSGVLAVGQQVGGTGITTGTTIASLGTGTGGNGTYILSAPMTVANGTVLQGGTNQATNVQSFLNALVANAVALSANGSVTGQFAPGNCFVNTTPTMTINSAAIVPQFHLLGYGTTITPNPSALINGLYIKRGTLSTHADEVATTTVEGLTINVRNNTNAQWGIEVDMPRVTTLRNNIYAGDDGTTHAQVNFAGIYYHQSNPTDASTGPFWGRILENVIKGNGVGVSAIPICMRLDGQVNALIVRGNTCNQGTYGMRIFNACASVTTDCAAQANGVVIAENAWESLTTGIELRTSVPSLTKLAGYTIYGNRVETMSTNFIDLTTITQQSIFPFVVGPNQLVGAFAYITNPNNISVGMLDRVQAVSTFNPASIAGGGTATFAGTAAAGATTSMSCTGTAVGDALGIIVSCFVPSTNSVTFRLTNPTSGAIDLPSMTFIGEIVHN